MKKEFGKWLIDVSKYMVGAFLLAGLLASDKFGITEIIIASAVVLVALLSGLYLYGGGAKKQQPNAFKSKNRPKKKFTSNRNKPIKENSFLQDNAG